MTILLFMAITLAFIIICLKIGDDIFYFPIFIFAIITAILGMFSFINIGKCKLYNGKYNYDFSCVVEYNNRYIDINLYESLLMKETK